MFGNNIGAWDEVAERKAEVKYKDEVGIKLVQHEVYGLNLEALRHGKILYHMGTEPGFRPSYDYLFTEDSLAKALQCTHTRVHHAVTRLKLAKPKPITEANHKHI